MKYMKIHCILFPGEYCATLLVEISNQVLETCYFFLSYFLQNYSSDQWIVTGISFHFVSVEVALGPWLYFDQISRLFLEFETKLLNWSAPHLAYLGIWDGIYRTELFLLILAICCQVIVKVTRIVEKLIYLAYLFYIRCVQIKKK